MIFPRLNYILTLSILLLCIFKSTTCLAIGPTVSADEARDIETCVAACQNFRKTFYTFAQQLNRESLEAAKKDFSTCQYRCYKCTMKKAINALDIIHNIKGDFAEEENRYLILNIEQFLIIESVQLCEDKWKLAASMGCNKMPVEDAVNLNTKDCVQ